MTPSKQKSSSEKMKIRCTEENGIKHVDEPTGEHFNLAEGDVRTVPADVGRYFCNHGWAEDVDGDYPTGERVEGASEIIAHDVTLKAGS